LEATGAQVQLSSLGEQSWNLSTVFDSVRDAIIELVEAENASHVQGLGESEEIKKSISALREDVRSLYTQFRAIEGKIDENREAYEKALEDGRRAADGDKEGIASKEEPPDDAAKKAEEEAAKAMWMAEKAAAEKAMEDMARKADEEAAKARAEKAAAEKAMEDAARKAEEEAAKAKAEKAAAEKAMEDVARMAEEAKAMAEKAALQKASIKPGEPPCSASFAAELDVRLQGLEREVPGCCSKTLFEKLAVEVSRLRQELEEAKVQAKVEVAPLDSQAANVFDEEPIPSFEVDLNNGTAEIEEAVAKLAKGVEDMRMRQESLRSTMNAQLKALMQENRSTLEGHEETKKDLDALRSTMYAELKALLQLENRRSTLEGHEVSDLTDESANQDAAAKALLAHEGRFQDIGRALAQLEKSADGMRTELEALSAKGEENLQTALADLRTELKAAIAAAMEPLAAAQSGGAVEEATLEVSQLKASLHEETRVRQDAEKSFNGRIDATEALVRSLREETKNSELRNQKRQLVESKELSLDANEITEKLAMKANRVELKSMEHETTEIRKMIDRLSSNMKSMMKNQQRKMEMPDDLMPALDPCLTGAKCLGCGRPSEMPKFAGCLDMDMDLGFTDRQKDTLSSGVRPAHATVPKVPPALEPLTKPLPKPPPQFLMPEEIERRQASIRARQQLEKTRSLPGLGGNPSPKVHSKTLALPNVPNGFKQDASWVAWKRNEGRLS